MSEKNLDHLFEITKSSELALTKEEIHGFVNKIPVSGNTIFFNSIQSLFKLKYFLMVSLFVFIGSLLFIQTNQNLTTAEQGSGSQTFEALEEIYVEPIDHEIHFIHYENEPQTIASANIYESNRKEVSSKEKEFGHQSQEEQLGKLEKTQKQKPTNTKNGAVQTSSGSIDVSQSSNDKIKMSSREVMKLKRALYKNLVKDKLIGSKSSKVEIKLRERSIVVNGKELDVNLYTKYKSLTRDAGWGEKRMIRMTKANIRVGDFDGLNFTGIGVGLFFQPTEILEKKKEMDEQKEIEENDKKSALELKKEKVEKEVAALNVFVDEIYRDASGPFHSSMFFGNRYNDGVLRELHSGIYSQLIESKLIENYQSMIVIELKENQMILNGTQINTEIEVELNKFFEKYKLKRKVFRMFKMTEHSIALGDYRPGSFTGVFYLMI